METTIRKNSNRLQAIFDGAHNIVSYTLDNYFNGEACEKIGWDGQNWLQKDHKRLDGKLTTDGKGKYCLQFHSNYWVEFNSV